MSYGSYFSRCVCNVYYCNFELQVVIYYQPARLEVNRIIKALLAVARVHRNSVVQVFGVHFLLLSVKY